jgi:hypothetical protein
MGCKPSRVAKITFVELDCFGSVVDTVRYVPMNIQSGFFEREEHVRRNTIHTSSIEKTCDYGCGYFNAQMARDKGHWFQPFKSFIHCRIIVDCLIQQDEPISMYPPKF